MKLRLAGTVSLIAFMLGPGLGLAHGLHMVTCDPDHEPHKCAVCAQLAAGSTATVDESPALAAAAGLWLAGSDAPQSIIPRLKRQPAVPRAPPLDRRMGGFLK